MSETLQLLPRGSYPNVDEADPLRFYYWPILGRLYRRRVEKALAELPGGRRVLEVGFGSGVALVNLCQKYQRVDGLDLKADVKGLQDLFKSAGHRVHLRAGSALKMPYPSGSFDAVMLVSILEHLKPQELAAALKEVARVLKPGGCMVYGVPVERPLMVAMFWLLRAKIRDHHFSTEAEVAAAAERCLQRVSLKPLRFLGLHIYEVGRFVKVPKRRS
jgi:ubiquinone/menaquinone biosynthesis C-methylase UbiE